MSSARKYSSNKDVTAGKPYLCQCCDFSQNLDEEIGMSVLEDDLLDRVLGVVQPVSNLKHGPKSTLGKESKDD